MDRRCKVAGAFLSVTTCLAPVAWAATPAQIFDQALRRDNDGYAHLAFLLYRRAAEAGLPDAEFNVAVMLDSGRGVTQNIAKAATWYARAASHGNHRAAYNLGLLYEVGQGVPKNIDIARAWFAASGLPSAFARLSTPRAKASADTSFQPPRLVAPVAGARLDPLSGGVELVWTSQQQPEPVSFFVELRALGLPGSPEVISRRVGISSLFATPPHLDGYYAWRVTAVARNGSHRSASDWLEFKIAQN